MASAAGVSSSSSVAAPCRNGPVLNLVKSKLTALRKKQSRIKKLRGKESLNLEEKKLMSEEDAVRTLIKEYQGLHEPLEAAVQDELSGLVKFIYLGSLFDDKPPIMARICERGRCMNNIPVVTAEDLDTIAMLSSLMTSPLASPGSSHEVALQRCVEHVKLLLGKADQAIESGESSYAKLNKKLTMILGSDYFLREVSSVAASCQLPARAIIEKESKIQLISQQPRFADSVLFNAWLDSSRPSVYSIREYGISQLSISQVSSDHRCILETSKFQRLDTWLADEGENCWSTTYAKWNINRPSERGCAVIRGMILAVFTLHKEGYIHGSLGMLSSYGVQFKENYPGEAERQEVKVSLLYDNVEGSSDVPSSYELRRGRAQDIDQLRDAIFNRLLGGKVYDQYREDLAILHDELVGDIPEEERIVIVDHPSLWHWRRRLKFFHAVCLHSSHFCSSQYNDLSSKWNSVFLPDIMWREKADADPIFSGVLRYSSQGQGKINYMVYASEQSRFIRNFCEHISERELSSSDPGTAVVEYSYGQYIENLITKKFPYFLLELHKVFGM